jgi:SpoVK/Ycf46/Vps4 family AAA+-type ATPase
MTTPVEVLPQKKSRSVKSEAESFCSRKLKPFKNDSEILEAAQILFDLRREITVQEDRNSYGEVLPLENAVARRMHKALKASSNKIHMVKMFNQHRLNKLEKEILLFLSLSAFGMLEKGIRRPLDSGEIRIMDVQKALRRAGIDRLAVVHALSQGSRLISAGLVKCDEEFPVASSELDVSDEFLAPLFVNSAYSDGTWKVKTYEELLDKTCVIVKCLKEHSSVLDDDDDDIPFPPRWRHRFGIRTRSGRNEVERHLVVLAKTLDRHRNWPLSKVLTDKLEREEKLIILALMGKELGFVHSGNSLFTGRGLINAVSEDAAAIRRNIDLLRGDNTLRREEYIQVCGGPDNNKALEDEETLRDCEFELTDKLVERLKIKRRRKSSRSAREPQMTMEQIVLCPETMEALSLAEAQIRHSNVFLKEWGLGIRFPYGKGVILLFWGPPGVGKTAAAEALAHRIGKRIIVANYAEIQNCWVGQTEKNIVQIFREARDADAVLFWDEADAMFYDRDNAIRNWEVRDVNVLLQEIEKFGGVCILSTNREFGLDKALERRIAIKVEFKKPDREMRRQIWEKMIPGELPLASDVDFDKLADAELTGGEIKNVLLNAARLALCRGKKSRLTMADFQRAIEMESAGKWTGSTKVVGFLRK